MLYKYFTEKLTGLQGLSIEKVEENQNTIHKARNEIKVINYKNSSWDWMRCF